MSEQKLEIVQSDASGTEIEILVESTTNGEFKNFDSRNRSHERMYCGH